MVNVSMGYNCQAGWNTETNYAEGASTSLNAAVNGMGLVSEVTVTPSVARKNIYCLGNQVRVNDPILSQNYDVSITMEWQNATTNCAYHWINDIIDNYGTSRHSYCIRIDAKPDGTTAEYLYLEGMVVNNISFKFPVGDTITVEVSGWCKEGLGDDWSGTCYPTATSITVDTTDPEQWHGADIAGWSNIVDVSGHLQEFTVEINYNAKRIDDFDSGGKASLGAQEAIEISWSGSYYGDGTTMGDGGVLEDMVGDKTDNIAIDVDGSHTLTLTGSSIDGMTFPIKEKELIVVDFNGMSHSVTL